MGCSNSKPTGPQPKPLANAPANTAGPALSRLDEGIARILQEAGFEGHEGIRKALVENHCTMEVLRRLRNKGKLTRAIEDFGLSVALAERLEGVILSALDRETGEKEKAREQHVEGGGGGGEANEKAEGATGPRGVTKTETIRAVVAVGGAAQAIQDAQDKGDEAQEGMEENAVLVDAGRDILAALGKELGVEQALEGVRDVVSDFVGVAKGALDVIGSIPFVAPVARLASLVVRQVAAERATRTLCKGLIPLCACAFKVLKEAEKGTRGLSGCKEEVEKLRAALEEALEVVQTVRNRSFFRRALTAGRDAEGVREAVAAAAAGAAQTADGNLNEGQARKSQSQAKMRCVVMYSHGQG